MTVQGMRCVDDDTWDVAVDVGSGIRALQPVTGDRWLIEHACKTVHGYQLTVAPALDERHDVTGIAPLTITPSIACLDCSLHGWITDGVWRPC